MKKILRYTADNFSPQGEKFDPGIRAARKFFFQLSI
jgi:hypothetical protein